MRRFLVSYATPSGGGFVYVDVATGELPTTQDLLDVRKHVAGQSMRASRLDVAIIAVSEVSPEGPIVT